MLYGMTTRFRCADPQPVWRVWDAFGIETAEMIGYWEVSLTLSLSLSLSLSLTNPKPNNPSPNPIAIHATLPCQNGWWRLGLG